MWKATVFRQPVLLEGCTEQLSLKRLGQGILEMGQGLDRQELGKSTLMSILFFLQVREFFVLHRMVGRTQRGVLTPGYFEPCNFPSHISPLFWISFPFRSPPSIGQSSLCYTVRSHQLSILYIIVYIYSSVYMEKAMAPHSSTLVWKIPWTEEPGRLQSMGLLRVRHD